MTAYFAGISLQVNKFYCNDVFGALKMTDIKMTDHRNGRAWNWQTWNKQNKCL